MSLQPPFQRLRVSSGPAATLKGTDPSGNSSDQQETERKFGLFLFPALPRRSSGDARPRDDANGESALMATVPNEGTMAQISKTVLFPTRGRERGSPT